VAGWQAAAWAEAIRSGMRAKGIPFERAAARIGVPVSTFRTWLDGRHLPRVTVLDHWPALAELAGMSESELFRVAGVLPDAVTGSLQLAQATRELRDGLDRARGLLGDIASFGTSSAVSLVVNELSGSGIDWEIRLRSANRGNDVRITYHHYVGIVAPEQLRDWRPDQVRAYIQDEILAQLWRSLGLYWRVADVHDWPAAPELLIQVPEQESTRPPSGRSPRPDGAPILVLSPPWGYGELLASLVADGLGFGNIDFRYFGVPDNRPDRLGLVQAEIDHAAPGFVLAIPPLMLLDGLAVGSTQLRRALPILITYGDRIRDRASQVYRTVLQGLVGDADLGIARVRALCASALHGLPAASKYLHVSIADDDVLVDDVFDRHRMNDTIAWLALAVTSAVLDSWGAPPVPIAGPLRGLILPSGRLRRPPPMASQVTWRTVDSC
jgi:hypothetical protein